MIKSKPGPVPSSLMGNIGIFVGVTLALNGIIFGLGWDGTRSAPMPGIPPGWVVGSLWVVLFAGMGLSRWLLVRQSETPRWVVELPSLLAFLCLIYPIYTSGLRNDRVGFIGSVLTAAVALSIAVVTRRRSLAAAGCTAAVFLWLSYASAALGYGRLH